MSAPTVEYHVSVKCPTCHKQIFKATTTSEKEFKTEATKALSAGELHDCKGAPKNGGE
jgi:hypothetical protein